MNPDHKNQSSGSNEIPPDEKGPSLEQTTRMDAPLALVCPKIFFGLGTTGSAAVWDMIQHVLSTCGRLPFSINYLLIDAEANASDRQRNAISIGANGVGTDATKGRSLFMKKRSAVLEALLIQVAFLMRSDPDFPTPRAAQQEIEVHIVAGPGGTSGGCLHPLIDMLSEVSDRLSIRSMSIHVHLMGPRMAKQDLSRIVSEKQSQVIYSTFARNLGGILDWLAIDKKLQISTGGDRQLSISSRQRVRTISVIDQGSEEVNFHETSELVEYLGWTLYQRCLAAPGRDHENRIQDEIGLDTPYGW